MLPSLYGGLDQEEGSPMIEAFIVFRHRNREKGSRRGDRRSCLAGVLILLAHCNGAWAAVTDFVYGYCDSAFVFTAYPDYTLNFRAVKSSILTEASQRLYAKASSTLGTSSSNFMYGVYQCRGDVSLTQCSACVADALDVTLLCNRWRRGNVGCLVHYEYVPFYDAEDTMPFWNGSCSPVPDGSTVFQSNMASALQIVTTSAGDNGGFYVTRVGTGSSTVYVLGQCVGYFRSETCSGCLKQCSSSYYSQCGSADSSGGEVYQGSCTLIVSRSSAFLFNQSVVVLPPWTDQGPAVTPRSSPSTEETVPPPPPEGPAESSPWTDQGPVVTPPSSPSTEETVPPPPPEGPAESLLPQVPSKRKRIKIFLISFGSVGGLGGITGLLWLIWLIFG